MLGQTVSHYRILERLGAGGMGEVFLAEDLRLLRPVALKILPCCRGEEMAVRRQLLEEARLASALNHSSIAVIYDAEEIEMPDGPSALLAMEYVSGRPLDAWVREEEPDLDRRLAVAQEIAEALAHAHERGIVHRDVKPSNVMVTEAGRVKVLDFGLAVRQPVPPAEASTVSVASPGEVAGTVGYMAPELALGQPANARADVFSFGVLLYELVAGRRPFAGATAWEVIGAVLHREAPPLDLPDKGARQSALEQLLTRLLAKDPASRPGAMAEVAAEILRIRRNAAEVPALSDRAVAVMVFDSLSGSAADDWIGVGFAETIAADLAALSGLEVIARERVAEVRRRLEGGNEVAREQRLAVALGARWVVSGAVQRLGDVVRVTLRLTDCVAGSAESLKFDERIDGLFGLQDRVVAELTRRLGGTSGVAHAGEETAVVAAYEALAKGLLNYRTETFEGLVRATLFFEGSAQLDPQYARAHLELGVAWSQMGDYLGAPQLHERALASVAIARRLLPSWPRAQRETGAILVALGRDEEGIEVLERALETAPEEPTLWAGLGRAMFLGRADFSRAASCFERALAANPHAGWYWLQLAHCRTLNGELDAARVAAERAVELQEKELSGRDGSQIVGAHMRLGHVAARAGMPRQAIEHLQRELAFVGRIEHALRGRIAIELHMRMGAAHLQTGQGAEAEANFAAGLAAWDRRQALGADEPFSRYYAAAIHALRGDAEKALEDLERAAAARPRFIIKRARREPEFASLAGDPRFQALLER